MKKLAAPSSPPSASAPTVSRSRSFRESPIRTRRGLWPLADGYLESNVLGSFFRGMTWFVGLFLAFILVSGAQKIAKAHMPVSLLVQFILLQVPRLIVFTIPSSLLFGTVSTFTDMSSNGELMALRAGGMSLIRMLRAPLVSALVLAVIAFWLQESIVPQCEFRRGAISSGLLQNAKASDIFPIIDKGEDGKVKRVIQADDFDAEKLDLINPDIRINQVDGASLHITAKSAHWNQDQSTWIFKEGETTHEPVSGNANDRFYRNSFVEESFRTQMALSPDKMTKSGRDMEEQLADHNYEMISMANLSAYRSTLLSRLHQTQREDSKNTKKIADLKADARAATFGIHDKIATPLVVVAMILLGAPLGVRPPRSQSQGLALGLSLMGLLGYYLIWTLASHWGKGGAQQPILAAYLPFIIVVIVGSVLTWQKR